MKTLASTLNLTVDGNTITGRAGDIFKAFAVMGFDIEQDSSQEDYTTYQVSYSEEAPTDTYEPAERVLVAKVLVTEDKQALAIMT